MPPIKIRASTISTAREPTQWTKPFSFVERAHRVGGISWIWLRNPPFEAFLATSQVQTERPLSKALKGRFGTLTNWFCSAFSTWLHWSRTLQLHPRSFPNEHPSPVKISYLPRWKPRKSDQLININWWRRFSSSFYRCAVLPTAYR